MRNRVGFYYDKFMLVCIIASIVPLFFKESNTLFFVMEKATVCIFIADYLLRWLTADLRSPGRGKWAFLLYPITPFALLDLLSILPSLTVLNSGLKLFRLLRLNKAFKALRLLRRSKSFNMVLTVIRREKKGLVAVCALAGGYILLAALVMFQVEPSSFDTFFDAVYWAVVTLTTVGYGDIYPTSDAGRVISMISSIMGIAIVALPTGIITAGYMNELKNDDCIGEQSYSEQDKESVYNEE
ncbi:MAG: ion transporter [Clostridia bacterium]|nr:ion transporter [Clostridia bacterium]